MKVLGYVLVFFMVILFSGIGFIYYSEGVDAFSKKVVGIHEKLFY